jgi:hypothetical protein
MVPLEAPRGLQGGRQRLPGAPTGAPAAEAPLTAGPLGGAPSSQVGLADRGQLVAPALGQGGVVVGEGALLRGGAGGGGGVWGAGDGLRQCRRGPCWVCGLPGRRAPPPPPPPPPRPPRGEGGPEPAPPRVGHHRREVADRAGARVAVDGSDAARRGRARAVGLELSELLERVFERVQEVDLLRLRFRGGSGAGSAQVQGQHGRTAVKRGSRQASSAVRRAAADQTAAGLPPPARLPARAPARPRRRHPPSRSRRCRGLG